MNATTAHIQYQKMNGTYPRITTAGDRDNYFRRMYNGLLQRVLPNDIRTFNKNLNQHIQTMHVAFSRTSPLGSPPQGP